LTQNKLVFLVLMFILDMGLEVYAQGSSRKDVQNTENSSNRSIKGVCTNSRLIDLSGNFQSFFYCFAYYDKKEE